MDEVKPLQGPNKTAWPTGHTGRREHKMMKYYIGYYNEPWDKSKFTVVAAAPSSAAAIFILARYKEYCTSNLDIYVMITAAEAMEKTLIF